MRFFFFNDTAPTEIYTLSLHDALPIYLPLGVAHARLEDPHEVLEDHPPLAVLGGDGDQPPVADRSEEHTSELQSRQYLVCRLLLEKKNAADNRLVARHMVLRAAAVDRK